jgi:hypothetical protein
VHTHARTHSQIFPHTPTRQGESELEAVEQELADGRGSRDRLSAYKGDEQPAGANGAKRAPTRAGGPGRAAQLLACVISPVGAGARETRGSGDTWLCSRPLLCAYQAGLPSQLAPPPRAPLGAPLWPLGGATLMQPQCKAARLAC